MIDDLSLLLVPWRRTHFLVGGAGHARNARAIWNDKPIVGDGSGLEHRRAVITALEVRPLFIPFEYAGLTKLVAVVGLNPTGFIRAGSTPVSGISVNC